MFRILLTSLKLMVVITAVLLVDNHFISSSLYLSQCERTVYPHDLKEVPPFSHVLIWFDDIPNFNPAIRIEVAFVLERKRTLDNFVKLEALLHS